jgi:hypothetical protein
MLPSDKGPVFSQISQGYFERRAMRRLNLAMRWIMGVFFGGGIHGLGDSHYVCQL